MGSKDCSTLFKTGQVANPNGRPKGAKSKYTIEWNKIRALAVENYQEAYKELRNHMKAGEGWAWQLFFRHLVPQKPMDDTYITVEIPEKLEDENADSYLKRFVEALKGKEEYTISEWQIVSNTLNRIRFTEKVGEEGTNIYDIFNDDEIEKLEDMVKVAQERQKSEVKSS